MAWDEKLFGHLHRLLRRKETPKRGAPFAPRSTELTLLASAVAGRAVTLTTASVPGVALRAPADAPSLSVPELLDAPDEAWIYRVIHAATSLRLGLVFPSRAPSVEALASLLAAPVVQRMLFAELPSSRAIFERVAPPMFERWVAGARRVEIAERWLAALVMGEKLPFAAPWTPQQLQRAVDRIAPELDGAKVDPFELFGLLPHAPLHPAKLTPASAGAEGASGTERQARNVKAKRRIDLEEEKNGENPLVHSFEKVRTAEEYKGGRRTADASDEMAEHGEALDELAIEEVVRSRARARSVYRADLAIEIEAEAGEAAAEASGIPYDEWDEAKRAYRRGWCSVFERVAPALGAARALAEVRTVVAEHRKEIQTIRGELARIDRAHAPRPRQPEGNELDLEAIVDRHAALAASVAPPEKLYVSRRRRPPDIDVLLLLDASLSTDAWVQNRRVIDVARQSIVVLGAALHDARVRTMVAAFHSNTRRDCRFEIAKRFEESWLLAARRMLSIEPTGYTRIGPALRHGTAKLVSAGARRRVLLLLSDAKPTDTDRYEGRYGIADVRQAVREAHAEGVDVLALAIEASARVHFSQMFGPGRHALLRRPGELPFALARIFLELAR